MEAKCKNTRVPYIRYALMKTSLRKLFRSAPFSSSCFITLVWLLACKTAEFKGYHCCLDGRTYCRGTPLWAIRARQRYYYKDIRNDAITCFRYVVFIERPPSSILKRFCSKECIYKLLQLAERLWVHGDIFNLAATHFPYLVIQYMLCWLKKLIYLHASQVGDDGTRRPSETQDYQCFHQCQAKPF